MIDNNQNFSQIFCKTSSFAKFRILMLVLIREKSVISSRIPKPWHGYSMNRLKISIFWRLIMNFTIFMYISKLQMIFYAVFLGYLNNFRSFNEMIRLIREFSSWITTMGGWFTTHQKGLSILIKKTSKQWLLLSSMHLKISL